MLSAAGILAIALAAALLAGCGIHDPYQRPTPAARSTTAPRAPAQPAPGQPDGPTQPQPPPAAGASSARAALERFASLYVNWQAVQLPERARQLAALSTGQARGQALALQDRAAALQRYQVANTGVLAALAPGQGPEQGRWAVVTNESTSGTGPYAGLPATSHVTWATVARTQNGYVITGWYPAS
jgi:hypothetical protein